MCHELEIKNVVQKRVKIESYNQRQIEELMGIWKRGYYRKNGTTRQK
jgi:hypothetical protein